MTACAISYSLRHLLLFVLIDAPRCACMHLLACGLANSVTLPAAVLRNHVRDMTAVSANKLILHNQALRLRRGDGILAEQPSRRAGIPVHIDSFI